jgi:tRNA dimethylallyltransferase
MIDFVEPNEEYNVALYQRDVYNNLISNFKFLISNQIPNPKSQNTNYKLQATSYKLPFLVGGTGQYIDAVVDNWQFPEGEPNLELRQKLTEQIKSKGLDSVWNQLMKIDPDCARFVQKENPRRVARALEYVLTTGKKFSAERRKGKRQFEVLKIGIDLPRDELYKKIDERVEARLKLEMIEEVQTLHDKHGLSWERLQNFGLEYRVIADWLCRDSIYAINGVSTTVAQRLKWAIHDYARRQMTWFRRDKEIGWVKDCGEAEKLTAKFFNF